MEGYLAYLRLYSSQRSGTKPSSSENAYKKFCDIVDFDESKSFRNVYEFVNVRTYSEAICETIGSLMSIAVSNGRNIQPFNLDKELYMRFNLPPLHKIQDFVKFVAKNWREVGDKEFYMKSQRKATSRLKLSVLSSSLSNYRSREEELAHFPVTLWEKQ